MKNSRPLLQWLNGFWFTVVSFSARLSSVCKTETFTTSLKSWYFSHHCMVLQDVVMHNLVSCVTVSTDSPDYMLFSHSRYIWSAVSTRINISFLWFKWLFLMTLSWAGMYRFTQLTIWYNLRDWFRNRIFSCFFYLFVF